MNAPSLSQSGLLLSPCLAWARPEARWYDDRYADTSKRDKGTTCHTIIDLTIQGHENQIINTLGKVPTDEENRISARAVEYFQTVLLPRCDVVHSEVAIGIDWVSGDTRFLGRISHRDYPKDDDANRFMWGTADLVCLLKDGSLLVADWKTGGTDSAKEQLLSLACGLRHTFTGTDGKEGNWFRRVRISCLFVDENGCWPDEQEVSEEELNNHWQAMKMQWEDIGVRNEEVPGIHCSTLYCPHLAHCPAIAERIQSLAVAERSKATALVSPERLMVKHHIELLETPGTDDEAGSLIETCTSSDRMIKYLKETMKERVKNGGRVTSGQYEWLDKGNGFRWHKMK